MSRLTNRILLAALLGLFLTAPGIVRSQGFNARTLQRAQQRGETGNLYGTNPYEQTGEEGEEGQDGQPQDTTKKERRIRKPLESYFFSDSIRALNNFRWSVKRDYNRVEISPLDTTLTDWRIDYPFFREEVGDIAQGALGQTSLPMNYFRRPQFFDFSFASPYYAYTYDMENVPFYNTKKPIIRMTYLESGQKRFREENFNIMHAQNISAHDRVQRRLQGTGNAPRPGSTSTTRHGERADNMSGHGRRTTTCRSPSAIRASAIRCMRPITTTTSNSRRTAAWSGHGLSQIRRSRCLRACR